MFRRVHPHQRSVLELAAISTLLAIILMTSMQILTKIPHDASAQLKPTSLQESRITSITPTTVSPSLGGQPIVPASSDTIDDMTENATDPLENSSLSSMTQQATTDYAFAGHPLAIPLYTAGCVSLCAAIGDESIANGGVIGNNGVTVSNVGNVGGEGGTSGGNGDGGDGDGGDGDSDGSGGDGDGDGDGIGGDGSGGGGNGDGGNGEGSGGGGNGDGGNGDGSGGDGDGSGGDGDGGNGDGGNGDGSGDDGSGDDGSGGDGSGDDGSGGDGDGGNGDGSGDDGSGGDGDGGSS